MSDLSLAIKLSTEGGQVVVKELTQIGQAAGVTNRDLESTGPAGDAASKGLAVTAASAATLNSHLMMLMRTVGVVAGGLGAFALIDRSDEWGQYASRIRHATKSVDEYDYVQQRMVSSANDTFRAITETKESFIQMSPILRDMGYQLNQSIDIVDSFSSLLVVNAARADRAAAAQSALAGSIQRGGVDADAWKTIFGTMPTILDNLTAATGKTASEIRQLGITGKLSITDLTNALLLSYQENRKAVEAMPTTVRDALQSFNTVFTEYIGWQNEAKGVTASLADGIVFLAEHFDTLVSIVGGAAVGALTLYSANTLIALKATVALRLEKMASLAIDAQAAIGAERAAIAEKNAAFASLERARAAVVKAEAEVAASQRIQAAELSRLKAVQAALLGESALEAQRHRAQISDIGRQQSTARIAELRLAQVAITKQLELGEKALAATTVSASATVQAAHAKRAQAAAASAAATEAANRATIASEKAAAAASKTAMAGRGLLAVFGGPAGLAITAGLAATAFLEFGSSAGDAKKRAEELKKEARELTATIEDLNKVQARPQLAKANEDLVNAEAAKAILEQEKAVLESRKKLQDEWAKNIESRSEKEQQRYAGAAAKLVEEFDVINAALDTSDAEIKTYQKRVEDLQAVLNGTAGAGVKPDLPVAANKELEKALLGVYNAQMLNATAVDAYGVALNGIDLELFKAEFEAVTKLPDDAAEAIKRFAAEAKTAQKNLEISTYSTELSKQIGLLDIRLAKGEQEYELQKALAQFTGADPARLNALQAELAIMQQKQALVADRTTLADLTKENDLLMVRLAHGEKEYEVQKALAALKGKDPAVLAAIESELRLRQQLNEKITISEEIAGSAFRSALDDMSALSSAGDQFGDALTQAFGRVAQQIDGMTSSQVSYNRQLEELAKKRREVEKLEANSPKRAAALLDIQRTETRLGREHFQAQIGQYAALTGAASQMFGEQSKEREKLHKLEQAFSVIEMALAMERAAANALAAIANQGSGDPYSAFARIAAMAALMAGLGLFSGSASGNANMSADRQASQGTGTVLGDSDAKSASISNALDRIAELSLDQYVELRAINSNIKALSSGIANLAVNLVSNFGKFNEQSYQGELGTNKQFQLNGSLASVVALGPLGGAVDQLLGGFVGNIFNSVLGGLSKTTKNLVDSGIAFDTQKLGDIIATGLVDASYYNVIETTKRKLWGLSKKTSTNTEYTALDKELEAEFGRIFGFLGSSITAAVDVLGVDVTRSLDNFVINLPNISFKDLSGDEIAKELEAVFSQQADLMAKYVLPSISQYQKMGEGLYDTLIRVAQEQAIFNAQLDALGLQLGDVSAALRIDVAQSIIELMGGVEAFRDATSEYFSAFYSDAEQFDYLSKTVSQAFASLGLSVPATREQFKAMVDALDLTTDAGQQLFAQLMQLVPGLDQYFDGLAAQTTEFEDATQRLADALAQQLAAINGVLDSIGKDILGLQRTLPGFDNVAYITGQIEQLTGALSGSDSLDEQLDLTQQLRAAVMERYNAELAAMSEASRVANELNKAEQDAYKAELAAVQALNKAAETLQKTAAQMLIGDLSPLTTGQRLAEAQSQFDSALAVARGGDADAYSLVQSLGQQILQLQKEFNPAAYTDVFGDIKAIFDELGGNIFAEPEAPALHPDLIAYENQKIALAEQTITELQRLQEQTASLRNVAQQEYTIQMQQIPVVNGAVVVNNDKVVAQIKELQAAQVAAAQQAAQQQAIAEAKQQQHMAVQEQQQNKIWRAIQEQNELMYQVMR